MKSKMRKKMIAFLLCMVLVICNSVSILADTPAEATTTVEKQTKQTGETKETGTGKKETKTGDADDTKESLDSDSPEESKTTQEKDETGAPETKTTEAKEDTTKATTETKEDSDKSDEVTTEEKKDSDEADEVTTKAKDETTEASEEKTTEKATTEAAEETSTTGEKEETDEAEEDGEKDKNNAEETTTEAEEKTTEAADEETAPVELTYDDENVTVTVSAVAEGAIPEGVTLKVVPILKDDTETQVQYTEVEQKIQEKAAETETEIKGFLAYDITFVEEDGNEIEPNSEVKVSMEYKEAALPAEITAEDVEDAEVSVMHLEEDDAGNVAEVVDMGEAGKVDTLETTDAKQVEKVEVKTESFSVFTVVWESSGIEITVHYVNDKYQEITDDDVQTEQVSLHDGETIVFADTNNGYVKNIDGYNFDRATIGTETGRNEKEIYSARVNEEEQLQYKENSGYNTQWRSWPINAGYDVYLIYNVSGNGNGSLIETVDNETENITINLFNYDVNYDKEVSTYPSQDNGYNKGINEDHDLKFLSEASSAEPNMNKYTGNGGGVRADIVAKNLDNNGYPKLANNRVTDFSEESLSYLFNDTPNNYKDAYIDVNHLLTKDTDGYFSFNSDENFAHFNEEENKFDVYSEGFQAFYPFNTFEYVKSKADYSGKTQLEYGNADHYFGMTMEASFYQPKDGQLNGEDMVFEFSGDDDVWIFIDNTLVLDLGGIHQRADGSINFRTGEVKVNGSSRNIDDLSDIFNLEGQSTFDDYTIHTIKLFYLERGNSASNCEMKFNLPTIPEGAVMVGKEVTNTEGTTVTYAQDINYEFVIEKYTTDKEGNKISELLANTTYEIRDNDNHKIGESTTDADGHFTLKHGQWAVFEGFLATDNYQVKEIGASLSDGYDIEVNEGDIDITFSNEEGGTTGQKLQTASTGKIQASGNTAMALFTNKIKQTSTLTVSKELANGSESLKNESFIINLYIGGERYDGQYILLDKDRPEDDGTTKTAENGTIFLKVDQSIKITGLPYTTDFEVKEAASSKYYPTYEWDGIYDVTAPSYDTANKELVTNGVFSVSGRVSGEGEVAITNHTAPDGGNTQLDVMKRWDDDILLSDRIPVEVTLKKGTEESGEKVTPPNSQENPVTLSETNSWKHSWTSLPGDTNYYVEETENGFVPSTGYTYSYVLNNDFKKVDDTKGTYFVLGTNAVIAIMADGKWTIWTSEEVEDNAKDSLITALNTKFNGTNSIPDSNSGDVTFIHGDNPDKGFHYQNGNLEITGLADSNWEVLGYGTYTKTINAVIINNIDEDSTINIPVEKIWRDGNYSGRPDSVKVQLYKQINDENAVPVEERTLTLRSSSINPENNWKGTFKNLPCWEEGTDNKLHRIVYTIQECMVGNVSLSKSGYASTITGDANTGFEVINTREWQIQKVSASENPSPGSGPITLTGAEFVLIKNNSETYYGKSNGNGIVGWYTDNSYRENFKIQAGDIKDGIYTFSEEKAPAGYQKSTVSWTIEIENGYPISVKQNGKNVNPVEGQSILTYRFENQTVYFLPSAGGPGIYWYTISGALLMIGAALIVYREKRKREVLLRK